MTGASEVTLIERIEAAECGSRELDVRIALATGWDIPGGGMEPFCVLAKKFGFEWALETASEYNSAYRALPAFSTSLDAAMSLTKGWARIAVRYMLATVLAKLAESNLEAVDHMPRLICAHVVAALKAKDTSDD